MMCNLCLKKLMKDDHENDFDEVLPKRSLHDDVMVDEVWQPTSWETLSDGLGEKLVKESDGDDLM